MAGSVLTILAVAALAVSVAALIMRHVPSVALPVLVTAAFAPYLLLGAPLALVLFGALHSWILATVAGAATIAAIAVQAPLYLGGNTDAAASIRLVSANL